MAERAPGPAFDDLYQMVCDVMQVGVRKYEFTRQAPWFVSLDLIVRRTRSRDTDEAQLQGWIDADTAAIEVVALAAQHAAPEDDEGLKAIGSHIRSQNRDLARRSELAAEARGLHSETSGRHWRQSHMKPFMRQVAKELYWLLHNPGMAASSDPEEKAAE